MRRLGWILFLLGFGCIIGGLLSKRVFHLPEYLIALHIIGGILIIVGGMLAFSSRTAKR